MGWQASIPEALDVHAHRAVAEHADGGLAAVAQAEVDVGMVQQEGFAVFAVPKHGRLADAIFVAKALTQKKIGTGTQLPPQFVAELECLSPALLGEQRQGSGEIEPGYVIVQIYHRTTFHAFHATKVQKKSSHRKGTEKNLLPREPYVK